MSLNYLLTKRGSTIAQSAYESSILADDNLVRALAELRGPSASADLPWP